MEPLILILIGISSSFLLAKLFKYFRIPEMFGPVLVGIVAALPYFRHYLISQDIMLLEALSDLGIIFLTFYIGLKMDLVSLEKHSKRPLVIALLGFAFPFAAGFVGCFFAFGFGIVASLVVAFAISLTSTAITVTMLKQTRLFSHRSGENLLGAGLIDNLFGFVVLFGLVTYIKAEQGLMIIVMDFLIFLSLIYIARYVIVPAVLQLIEKRSQRTDLFVVSLLMVLLMAILSAYLGVDSIIGAFVAGVVVRYTMLSAMEFKEEREVTELIEVATFGFLAPFFFIWIGFNFDVVNVFRANYILVLFLLAAALGGKYLGAFLGSLSKDSNFIGWGMNIRGEMELVIVEIARNAALITVPVFSAVVLVSFLATIISAFFLRLNISKKLK